MSRHPFADPCMVCADQDRDCPRHVSATYRPGRSGPWWQAGVIAQGFLLGMLLGMLGLLAFFGALALGQAVLCAAHDGELRYCDVGQVQR